MALSPVTDTTVASLHWLAARSLSAQLPGPIVFGGGMLVGVVAVVVAGRQLRRLAARRAAMAGLNSSPVLGSRSDLGTTPESGDSSPASQDGQTGVLADLEELGVALLAGSDAAVVQLLASAVSELTAGALADCCDLILVGFPDLGTGRVTYCADLASALDLVVANAVVLRRKSAETRHERRRPASKAAARYGVLTMLVSQIAPAPAELTLLIDLAAEPGGVSALLPSPGERIERETRVQAGSRRFTVLSLTDDRAAAPPPPTSTAPSSTAPASTAPTATASATLVPAMAAPTEPPANEPPANEPGTLREPVPLPGLRIGLLGTLTINGQPGALVPAQSQLIVALALSGAGGLSNRRLCGLLGADPDHPRPTDSLRQLIVRTRRQLGRVADGRELIEHLGHGNYALHPATRVDWAEFDALTAVGIRDKAAGELTEALSLVRGQPFAGCYYWWLDEALVESVTAKIVTAAEVLAEINLASSDSADAARAARIGLMADTSAEQLWRLLMRAEHAAGNLAGVREAWGRYRDTIAEISADGEPDPSTAAVYHELLGGRSAGSPRIRPASRA